MLAGAATVSWYYRPRGSWDKEYYKNQVSHSHTSLVHACTHMTHVVFAIMWYSVL